MKKGFVLTIDAMLALIAATVFIAVIMYYLNAPRLETEEYLYLAGGDFLAVSDVDGSILTALEGDGSPLADSIAYLPDNICVNITVDDALGGRVFGAETGCGAPDRYVVSRRTIVNNTRIYVASARVWYR
ncbi:MAG: hypothetical protein V1875_00680 [Candidatus Altiarchaeota archaeon]